MEIDFFKDKIINTYRTLGVIDGYSRNCRDIHSWHRVEYINDQDYDYLSKFNKEMEKSLKTDERIV